MVFSTNSVGPVRQALASMPFLPALPATVAKWVPGESPFSTHTEVVGALAVYLAVIFGGQWLMSDRKPFRESLGFSYGQQELDEQLNERPVRVVERVGPK